MDIDPRIQELLVTWEDARSNGQRVSLEDLCHDCQDLLPLLQQRVSILEKMYKLLAPSEQQTTANRAIGDTRVGRNGPVWPSIEGFECVEHLGSGGMGTVFRARQLRLGRDVAVKLLPRGAGDTHLTQRFLAEAEAAATLRHPNIVQVYDVGEHAGQPYVVLEYVAGGDLRQLVAGQPQPDRAVAALIQKIARALSTAHQRGIVHRDIKPANILVDRRPPAAAETAEGNGPFSLADICPKLTDFGIAKRLDTQSDLTATGDLIGTPAYMAPEQIAEPGTAIGPAADIFALGVTLYELLVGRTPFAGPTALETIRLIQSNEPLRPSALQPTISTDLETICLKCLEKDPTRRYATAEELADDLARFLSGRPVKARPIGGMQRGWRWCRRNPAIASLSMGLVLASVAGVSGVTWKWIEAERARARSDINFQRAQQAVDDNLTLVGDEMLLEEPGMQELRRKLLTGALDYYQKFIEEAEQDPSVRSGLASAYHRLGRVSALVGSPEQAITQMQQAIELQRSLVDEHPDEPERLLDLADYIVYLGRTQFDQAAYQPAAEQFQEAVSLLEGALAAKEVQPARWKALLFTALYRQLTTEIAAPVLLDKATDFQKLFDKAVKLGGEAVHEQPDNIRLRRRLAMCYLNQSNHLAAVGQIQPAIETAEKSAWMLEELVTAEPNKIRHRQGLGLSLGWLAKHHQRAGNLSAAADAYNRSLEIQSALVAENPLVHRFQLDLFRARNAFATLLELQNKPDDAIAIYRQNIALGEQLVATLPDSHMTSSLAISYHNLAGILNEEAQAEEQAAAYIKSIELMKSLVSSGKASLRNRSWLAAFRISWGRTNYDRGEFDQALQQSHLALEITEQLVDERPDEIAYRYQLAKCLNLLAHSQLGLEQFGDALATYRRSSAVFEQLSQRDPDAQAKYERELAVCLHQMAITAAELDDRSEAEALFEQTIALADARLAEHPDSSFWLTRAYWATRSRGEHFADDLRRQRSDYRRAIEFASRLVQLEPDNGTYQTWRDKVDEEVGKLQSAPP